MKKLKSLARFMLCVFMWSFVVLPISMISGKADTLSLIPIPVIDENFENMTENLPPASPWISTSNVSIVSDSEQGKCVNIVDNNSSSSFNTRIPFPAVSDYLTVSFKFKFKFTSSTGYIYFSLYDGGTEYVRLRIYNTGTAIRLENQASSNTTISSSVTQDTWHNIKFLLNIKNKEIWVFFDEDKNGIKISSLYNMSVTQISELRFATHSTTIVSVYIDDVKVFNQDVINIPPIWLDSNVDVVNLSPKSATLTWNEPWDLIGVEKI